MAADLGALAADLRAETAVLDALLAPLDEPGWHLPTPAPGWTVLDQVTHLAFFDEITTIAATEPARFRVLRDEASAAPEGPVESAVARSRHLSGAEAHAWLTRARAEMIEALCACKPGARVSWFGPDMSPASAMTARIMETWAHGQDIADALGAEHPPTAALRQVAHIGVRALPNSFVARGLPVPSGPVYVELSGPVGELWTWGDPDAADRVQGPALDFCLVATRRRHPDDADLLVVGPVAEAWIPIAQAFAGPPGADPAPRGGR